MNNHFLRSFIAVFLVMLAGVVALNCKKHDDPKPGSPSITSFSPSSGTVSTAVTITGKNFSSSAGANTVKINGVEATVSAATATQLSILVGNGTRTGKITVEINGNTASSSTDFAILQPTIASFTPTHGASGTVIEVTGTNFSTIASDNHLTFGSAAAAITSATSSSISATVPDGAASSVLTLSVNGFTVGSEASFDVVNDFPRNGLVAFYPFSGNANDESGNALNAQALTHGTGGGPVATTDRFGTTAHAYSLNGVDDYIKVANKAKLQISGAITIAMWVQQPTPDSKTLLMKETGKYDDMDCNGYYLFVGPDDTRSGIDISTKHAQGIGTNATYSTGTTWAFIAITIDGTTLNTYTGDYSTSPVILSPVTVTGINPLTDCAADLYIGGEIAWDNPAVHASSYLGKMDDVMIYSRALSPDEIQKIYQQNFTKY